MIEDKMEKLIDCGKLYVIQNFAVKNYTDKDKYRVVLADKQLIFTTDTKVKEIDENEIFIPKNMFDLNPFQDLKKMATQQVYLAGDFTTYYKNDHSKFFIYYKVLLPFITDVIGIIPKKESLRRFKNNLGQEQSNIKFKISDGK